MPHARQQHGQLLFENVMCACLHSGRPVVTTFALASAVGIPLMSNPLLLLLDATAIPCSQNGKPSPLLLLLLLVEAASADSVLPAPLPLLLPLLLVAAGSTTRLTSRPNF